ncbi:MAG TPA: HDOD domain-containing protein, partial [Candidatus Hydrogenedentes bacterium]|nr:HDOD domain-containing protein [Candidatus Hydrogenedentota bacterium]
MKEERRRYVEGIDLDDAVERVQRLPTLPSVLGRIFATVADPDASALDLGRHIAADQSLSATLLKLVNSAYYGFSRRIDSVTTAIVMLGFVEV